MVASVDSADSQDRLPEPSTLALVTIQCVLVAGTLSFGVFPLLIDALERLVHYDVQSAGLSVTAEMLGQSVGAAAALVFGRRLGSRRIVAAALIFIIVCNGLSVAAYPFFPMLLALRGLAGVGCGLTVVCIGLLATAKHADRNFAIFNMATLVGPGLLAAAVPETLHVLGVGGVYAVIAGSSTLCLWMVPLVPDSYGESRSHQKKDSSGRSSFVLCTLTCAMSVAYFVSATMFWSYAGDLGAKHHMSVSTVSSAVAQAWLVGGPLGAITAILVIKRLPRMLIIVVSAVGGAATTYAAIYVLNTVAFGIVLSAFQFFWTLLYPVQMGLFAWVDTSGRLAMLAWFVQLIACAIGPAIGGFVLHVSSYSVLALLCAIGYCLFILVAFVLGTVAKQNVTVATGSIAG